MNPELLEALKMLDQLQPTELYKEPRLYYNESGEIIMYCETDHPAAGEYIVLKDADVFFKNNTARLRVVNGELKVMPATSQQQLGLRKATQGQRVVKGLATIALEPTEEYQDIEYYDRKTDN
jgi:hypothetical protein